MVSVKALPSPLLGPAIFPAPSPRPSRFPTLPLGPAGRREDQLHLLLTCPLTECVALWLTPKSLELPEREGPEAGLLTSANA